MVTTDGQRIKNAKPTKQMVKWRQRSQRNELWD